MARLAPALAALLAATAAPAQEAPTPTGAPPAPEASATPSPRADPAEPPPSAPAREPVARGAVLEEVSGTVRAIDRSTYRMSVETAAGPVTLTIDRNTMVYTAAGLGTVVDVVPGAQIRAGRNAEFLAYWVQVRTPARGAPPSTPGQGTGPAGGGSAPASESVGPGTGPAPAPPTATPGGVPPGAASPGGPAQ